MTPEPDLSWFNPETFNPADGEQMKHLFDVFTAIWMKDAHNLIASKIYDIRSKQSVVTSDIFNDAFIQFRKYYEDKPDFRFADIQEVKKTFTLYIHYEICNAISEKKNQKVTLADEVDTPSEAPSNFEQALCQAVSKLSVEEYTNCHGLTPLLLYEFLIYWGESPSVIANRYDVTERTIRNYRTDIVKELAGTLEDWGFSPDNNNNFKVWVPLSEENNLRLQILSIVSDNPTPLRQGDIILSINGSVYEHVTRLKSQLKGSKTEKTYRIAVCRLLEATRDQTCSELIFEVSKPDMDWLLKNATLRSVKFDY